MSIYYVDKLLYFVEVLDTWKIISMAFSHDMLNSWIPASSLIWQFRMLKSWIHKALLVCTKFLCCLGYIEACYSGKFSLLSHGYMEGYFYGNFFCMLEVLVTQKAITLTSSYIVLKSWIHRMPSLLQGLMLKELIHIRPLLYQPLMVMFWILRRLLLWQVTQVIAKATYFVMLKSWIHRSPLFWHLVVGLGSVMGNIPTSKVGSSGIHS